MLLSGGYLVTINVREVDDSRLQSLRAIGFHES
jgi:hypothetical protein